ncbi:MAG: hypothetical protein AAF810_04820 [Cyanobacteria bacterium P01_D01_bin.36]
MSDSPSSQHSNQSSEQHIVELRSQYLSLINDQLPAKATQSKMPVRFNHCFARITLDNVFQDCWYNHLSRKQPAYKQLNESQLKAAIKLAKSMLQDSEMAVLFNQNSLRWRGKL